MKTIEELCKEQLKVDGDVSACNFFVQAVAREVGVESGLVSGITDSIVSRMRSGAPYTYLGSDPHAATTHAEAGYLVIGGLESSAIGSSASGHVFIVVPGGPSAPGLTTPWGYPSRGGQPYCYHGSAHPKLRSKSRLQVDFIFSRVDESKVVYAVLKDPRRLAKKAPLATAALSNVMRRRGAAA